jgi:hypothetical protein
MCRIRRELLETAVIESLPLRQSLNFGYLQHVTTNDFGSQATSAFLLGISIRFKAGSGSGLTSPAVLTTRDLPSTGGCQTEMRTAYPQRSALLLRANPSLRPPQDLKNSGD